MKVVYVCLFVLIIEGHITCTFFVSKFCRIIYLTELLNSGIMGAHVHLCSDAGGVSTVKIKLCKGPQWKKDFNFVIFDELMFLNFCHINQIKKSSSRLKNTEQLTQLITNANISCLDSVCLLSFTSCLGVECCLRQMDRSGKLLPPGTFQKDHQHHSQCDPSKGLHGKLACLCSSA